MFRLKETARYLCVRLVTASLEVKFMKFHSKPVVEHDEVPLADDGRWEEIVDYWTKREAAPSLPQIDGPSKCYIVSVGSTRDTLIRQAQLAEIMNLASSLNYQIVGHEICYLTKPNPKTLLGKGTSEELAGRARSFGADLLILDAELSPSQMRNLEDLAGIPICDREAVILNVFLRHAKTRRAKIQVELAQLEYLRPRIRGVGINMDQQMGGAANSRGPGETASELLARKLDGRMAYLKRSLENLETSNKTQRQQRHSCQSIVLVGYTNAGKTSLMNALTAANLSARDMPFETLDTTSRCLTKHGGDVLLSDTVGFIRRLPEGLIKSFESTLTEICDASLLLIVVDASDYERKLHIETTEKVLKRLDANNIPRFYVFNKTDRLLSPLEDGVLDELCSGHPRIALSANDKNAVLKLKERLLQTVRGSHETATLYVPHSASATLSVVFGKCRVIRSDATYEGLNLEIQGDPQVIAQIRHRLKEEL